MGVPAPPGILASGVSPYFPDDKANFVVQGVFEAVGLSPAGVFYGPFNVAVWGSVATALTTTGGDLTGTVTSSAGLLAGASISSALVPRGTTIATLDDPAPNDITFVLPIYTLTGKVVVGQDQITDLYSTDWLLGAEVSGPGIVGGSVVTSIDVEAIPSVGIRGVVTIDNAVVAPTNPAFNLAKQLPFQFALSGDSLANGTDADATFAGGFQSGGIVYQASVNLLRSFDGGITWLPVALPSDFAEFYAVADAPSTWSMSEPEKGVLYRLQCDAYTSGTLNYRMSATGQAATSLAVPV